jgi:predicted glycogen debranching enzyme
MSMQWNMLPEPGQRILRFTGDRIRFVFKPAEGQAIPQGWVGFLRTNIGRAKDLRNEIVHCLKGKAAMQDISLRDIPMVFENQEWSITLPLTEVGYFKAKAYAIDPKGFQSWPHGPDIGINVQPNHCRTGNTIYCAFPRMFGKTKALLKTENPELESQHREWDDQGYHLIPPSGTFRDLIEQLPHILDDLGCHILHLLPINPTPVTYARFGRFGSPYASQDLTAVDPALLSFDKRTTGIDQFRELVDAVHVRNGRVFLDLAINHTGWGSREQECHPEWFSRNVDGEFHSPGAWGVVWEDLCELDHKNILLWEYLAEVFLIWCRRGVDGFRCDAGYMVPLPAWQYIISCVRQEFPNTVFLLAGLGGAWEATRNLLSDGGMQWAYSELFQTYSNQKISEYFNHLDQQKLGPGIMVHYSETHDNQRLAAKGRGWSLLRNRVCALLSFNGAFAYTNGVEWLAEEKVDVHQSRAMSWESEENIVPELKELNQLISEHPCFFDGAKLEQLSHCDESVLVFKRTSFDEKHKVWVLINTDLQETHITNIPTIEGVPDPEELTDLLQTNPKAIRFLEKKENQLIFEIGPGQAHCLVLEKDAHADREGTGYRRLRALSDWALRMVSKVLPVEAFGEYEWQELAEFIHEDAEAFIGSINYLSTAGNSTDLLSRISQIQNTNLYPQVIVWSEFQSDRVLPVPADHWLLIRTEEPFRATLNTRFLKQSIYEQSISVRDGWLAVFPPLNITGNAKLILEKFQSRGPVHKAKLHFHSSKVAPEVESNEIESGRCLLTNGRGGMARLCIDLGAVHSKYDAVLAANLDDQVPSDRHVFAKRIRVWARLQGFIRPLNRSHLISFNPGPPAVWNFALPFSVENTVSIRMSAEMLPNRNTVVFKFEMPKNVENLRDQKMTESIDEVRLIVRVDIEDRNFHTETHRNPESEYHFTQHCRPLNDRPGFELTPHENRSLKVCCDHGVFFPEPEWSQDIEHPNEISRGQTPNGDAYSPGWFDMPLRHDAPNRLTLCADPDLPCLVDTKPASITKTDSSKDTGILPIPDVFEDRLKKALNAFVVRRDQGKSVIAGYPWFLDWGRDSLICARGLLAAGFHDQVRDLLITFAKFEENGTLPNSIHGTNASNRDTSDAPLWFGIVCEETAELLGPDFYRTSINAQGRTIEEVLLSLAENYVRGTSNGIRMDPDSGLIWSPSHFTWMDTNHPAGSPREGYPIEIQALWIRLLRQLDQLNTVSPSGLSFGNLAEIAMENLTERFWMDKEGYFRDLLIGGRGLAVEQAIPDNALRSNCLMVIALGLFQGNSAKRCVGAVRDHLIIPGAIRSLASLPITPPLPVYSHEGHLLNDPPHPYWGKYEGNEDTRRKPAYHNGTAWVWPFPAFCEALALAWDCQEEAVTAAKAFLKTTETLLDQGCIGHLPEILDGDSPHNQRGCDAQAWSATETIRVWKWLKNPKVLDNC